MKDTSSTIWENDSTQQLVAALSLISDVKTTQNFLRDIMTEKEITEMSARLQAAKMLKDGATYAEIAAKTKLSSRTISRISGWLQNGAGGYEAALDVIELHHHAHIPPARV